MILRAAFAIAFAFISFGALVPPVYAENVLKAHPVKCLPKSYAAAERGLARTRAKWSEIVTENEGSFWADINNASDYAHRCEHNGKLNICKVYARPCRGDARFGPVGSD